MKLYLLYYDFDQGAREEWNTFYTPVEVFSSELMRARRRRFISAQNPNLLFYNVEVDLSETHDTPLVGYEYENEEAEDD
jgi:hypothetical protein